MVQGWYLQYYLGKFVMRYNVHVFKSGPGWRSNIYTNGLYDCVGVWSVNKLALCANGCEGPTAYCAEGVC
jgi:hypothetical protein